MARRTRKELNLINKRLKGGDIMGISLKQIERSVLIAKEYGAKRLILFGSALDSPEQANDLDLACDGIEGWALFEFGGRLEEELNIPVDIVPLKPPTGFSRMHGSRGAEGRWGENGRPGADGLHGQAPLVRADAGFVAVNVYLPLLHADNANCPQILRTSPNYKRRNSRCRWKKPCYCCINENVNKMHG